MATGVPSRSKRPARGPMISAPQKAAMPPVMCTTPEPAKSMHPWSIALELKAERKPEPSHTQWTTTG